LVKVAAKVGSNGGGELPRTTLRDGSSLKSGDGLGGITLRDGAVNANETQAAALAEAIRQRDEADARAAAHERALAAMQDEMLVLRRAAGGGAAGADVVRVRDELAAERARAVALQLELGNRAEWTNADVETMMNDLKAALDEEKAAHEVAKEAAAEVVSEA